MNLKDEKYKKLVDAKGQICPYPLITVRKYLKGMSEGEVLELEVDYEESAVNSIPNWCKKNNIPYEVIQLEDRLWRVYIKKQRS